MLRSFYTHKNTHSNAFTMIEVLIALSIVALVSVVALPNFKKFSARQDVINSSSTVVSILRKAQSNAVSDIRCSTDVAGKPIPSYSFDIHFENPTFSTSTICIARNIAGTDLDFILPHVLDTGASFQGTFPYNESTHIELITGPIIKKGITYDTTTICPTSGGQGYISFRGSGVYFACTNPALNPSQYCKLPVLTADTQPFCPIATETYLMILHDDRNDSSATPNADDIVITISPTGVVKVI